MSKRADGKAEGPTVSPSALAGVLAALTRNLNGALPTIADAETRRVLKQSLEGMRSVAASLQSIDMLFAPEHARQFAAHAAGLRRLAESMSEVVSDLTEASQHATSRLAEHAVELESIAELPSDADTSERLRTTVARVREMAAEMNESLGGITAKAAKAMSGIADLEGEFREAREKAFVDALTRVHSRPAFEARLESAVAAGETEGAWCMAVIAVDHFARVAAEHGQIVGDALLFRVARSIEGTLPGEPDAAFLARCGDERFALLAFATELAATAQIAEAIRSALETARWQRRDHPERSLVHVTASIGVTQYQPGDTPESILARAESALGEAQQSGHNRVVAR